MMAIIPPSPKASQRSWRSRKYEPFPYSSRAVTAEALNTMSAPIRHKASVEPNIHRSVWSCRGILGALSICRVSEEQNHSHFVILREAKNLSVLAFKPQRDSSFRSE